MVPALAKGQDFRAISSERKSELVIRQLRGLIESGRLKPGEKLPAEPELAARFGVSRTVLREALKVLELSGYLEVRRGYGGGTFVAVPSPEEFRTVGPAELSLPAVTQRQLHEVRLAIEPYAAGAATRAGFRDVEPLEDSIREMEVFDDRPARVLEANFGFHVAVSRASGNPVFVAVLAELRAPVYRDLNLLVRDPEWREACRREHESIVGEIRDGNVEGAESAMRRHLENELRVPEAGRGKQQAHGEEDV